MSLLSWWLTCMTVRGFISHTTGRTIVSRKGTRQGCKFGAMLFKLQHRACVCVTFARRLPLLVYTQKGCFPVDALSVLSAKMASFVQSGWNDELIERAGKVIDTVSHVFGRNAMELNSEPGKLRVPGGAHEGERGGADSCCQAHHQPAAVRPRQPAMTRPTCSTVLSRRSRRLVLWPSDVSLRTSLTLEHKWIFFSLPHREYPFVWSSDVDPAVLGQSGVTFNMFVMASLRRITP